MSETEFISKTSSPEHRISYDPIENDSYIPWFSLIQNFSNDQMENLKIIFREEESQYKKGLSKEEFLNAITSLYGNQKYCVQSLLLFEEINKGNKLEITWNEFLDFVIENLDPKPMQKVELQISNIEPVSHVKRETVVKIVLIETEKYFCYAIIAKHGRIGIYDGNLNFLTSYHVIMTREDITRSEEERRRRNRWVTDAIFCPDVLVFIVTNTARSIMIYDASGLKHVPLTLVLSTPNIIQCLAYKHFDKDNASDGSKLYMGDINGEIISFHFLQPTISLFRKKHNDKMSLFYWAELPNEGEYVIYHNHGRIHKESVKRIQYFKDNGTLFTCSRDPNASVVKQYVEIKRKPYIFKMPRGASAFSLSRVLKLLITGSDDGLIRLWNPVTVSKPIAILSSHQAGIVDIEIMPNQETFLSCSRDAVLKVWDIKEQKCLQDIRIKFPAFDILGKVIEWGTDSIYPGPKRESVHKNEETAKGDSYDVKEIERGDKLKDQDPLASGNLWERSNILVPCCNYIANIKLIFDDMLIEQSLEMPILQPPPLQNSVLIPSTWKIRESAIQVEKPTIDIGSIDIEQHMENLKFILDKDILSDDGLRSDINYKIATLEIKKLEMKENVARGAPYLALDLFDIEELQLSHDLPIPNKPKIKNLVEKTKKMLVDASAKDQIFSELSSSRSRSSRSSIVEFPY